MDFFIINQTPSHGDVADGPQSSRNSIEMFRTNFEDDDSVLTSSAPKCPVCGVFVGMLQSIPPFRVHLETWGTAYGDFAFWMTDILVTKEVRDAYRESSLSGLSEFSETEIVSHKNMGGFIGKPPEYFRTSPKIGSARIDVTSSLIDWKDDDRPTCAFCLGNGGSLNGWRKIVIDEGSWNGDDIFYAYGLPGVLLATSKFIEWAEYHHFKNWSAHR